MKAFALINQSTKQSKKMKKTFEELVLSFRSDLKEYADMTEESKAIEDGEALIFAATSDDMESNHVILRGSVVSLAVLLASVMDQNKSLKDIVLLAATMINLNDNE